MKMVKSLLLGSAAGLVAMAGAQAADLPVKAKPVEYVKICSIYGAGFFYIPGTDTCIKIGGFIRAEWDWNAGGSFNPGGAYFSTTGLNTRQSTYLLTRTRALMSLDIRSQTEYGTLRAYGRFAHQWTTGDFNILTDSGARGGGTGTVTYFDRAFIQLAGFTFGHAQSFFDNFVPGQISYQTNSIGSDTGGSGSNLIAYTAQFGNGFSATLSLEDRTRRDQAVADLDAGNFAINSVLVSPLVDNRGQVWPDVVANLRVDQAWGFAQINGAIHQVSAQYFNDPACAFPGTDFCGHPSDKVGWAVGGGFTLNLPWAKGDTFGATVGYAKGALNYITSDSPYRLSRYGSDTSVALGFLTDGVFTGPSAGALGTFGDIELTSGWQFFTGIEHFWWPNLRTSLYGGYLAINYNGAASTAICFNGLPFGVSTLGQCLDSDYSLWQVGSRTIWNPVPNLDIGLEIMYSKLNTAYGGLAALPANNTRPPVIGVIEDQNIWSAILRVQRNFWP
jgi:hypothetical protein